mgnify:CR=1 FL=1
MLIHGESIHWGMIANYVDAMGELLKEEGGASFDTMELRKRTGKKAAYRREKGFQTSISGSKIGFFIENLV